MHRMSVRNFALQQHAYSGYPITTNPHFAWCHINLEMEGLARLAEGAVQADLARSYGVSQASISRLAAPALSS
jgi:hypothetical protein